MARTDVSGQQPASENLRPVNSHISDLGRGSSPSQALRPAIMPDTLVEAFIKRDPEPGAPS